MLILNIFSFKEVLIWALALILTASCGPHVPTNKIIIKNLKTKITHGLSTQTMRLFYLDIQAL